LVAWAWDHASGCPAHLARDAAMVIKVLRSVWRESGIVVRDSRFTARSSQGAFKRGLFKINTFPPAF
jgi:hypothetical protein